MGPHAPTMLVHSAFQGVVYTRLPPFPTGRARASSCRRVRNPTDMGILRDDQSCVSPGGTGIRHGLLPRARESHLETTTGPTAQSSLEMVLHPITTSHHEFEQNQQNLCLDTFIRSHLVPNHVLTMRSLEHEAAKEHIPQAMPFFFGFI